MWGFPSIQSFFSNNAFLIFFALGVFGYSAFAIIHVVLSIKRKTKESAGEFTKNALIGAVAFFLAFFTFWGIISKYSEIKLCRNLDLSQVKNVRVRKMSNEETFSGSSILFKDSDKIREGLKILKNADSYKRKKIDYARETYLYGYQIQISEENSFTTISLNYFSETDNSQKTDVIIPDCGTDSDKIGSTDDIYFSNGFGNWIRENIEPEFKKIQ